VGKEVRLTVGASENAAAARTVKISPVADEMGARFARGATHAFLLDDDAATAIDVPKDRATARLFDTFWRKPMAFGTRGRKTISPAWRCRHEDSMRSPPMSPLLGSTGVGTGCLGTGRHPSRRAGSGRYSVSFSIPKLKVASLTLVWDLTRHPEPLGGRTVGWYRPARARQLR